MKIVGSILITIGLILLFLTVFFFIKGRNQMVSPIPDEKGVKVIFVTPTK